MGNSFFKISVLTISFLCVISFPLLNELTGIVKDSENTENRALAKKPVLDINILDSFPGKYEPFYNDNFSLRSLTIRFFNNFNLFAYKKSPFPWRLVIGQDSWLFLSGTEMDCYIGANRFNDEQLKTLKEKLELQNDFLKKINCKFYFVITPAKANVHSEKLPRTIYKYTDVPLVLQVNNFLSKNSDINVISLFEPFNELKNQHQLYYKLDNHWNQNGGFYASLITTTKIKKDFPAIDLLNPKDYSLVESEIEDGDIVRIISHPAGYKDSEFTYHFKKNNASLVFDPINYNSSFVKTRTSNANNNYKAFLMCDSYGNNIFPFFAESFGKTYSVFDRWKFDLNQELLEKEKPDIYVLMIHEPLLIHFVNGTFPF